jgi:uncharacterized protein (DUF924 family)
MNSSISRSLDSTHPEDVLDFWFGAPGSAELDTERAMWWEGDAAVDAMIAERFAALHDAVLGGARQAWAEHPRHVLAFVLVADQFSRHLYRGQGRAFEGDALALAAARHAVERGWDRDWSALQRQFLYMPFMHSEQLSDQRISVDLFEALAQEDPRVDQRRWAREYYAVIERCGRFPHRDQALGRRGGTEPGALSGTG